MKPSSCIGTLRNFTTDYSILYISNLNPESSKWVHFLEWSSGVVADLLLRLSCTRKQCVSRAACAILYDGVSGEAFNETDIPLLRVCNFVVPPTIYPTPTSSSTQQEPMKTSKRHPKPWAPESKSRLYQQPSNTKGVFTTMPSTRCGVGHKRLRWVSEYQGTLLRSPH